MTVRATLETATHRLGRNPYLGRRANRPAGYSAASPAATPSAAKNQLILKERAWEAGHCGEALDRIHPHSPRAGCITTLAQVSVHGRDIMQHSRYGSQAVMRGYIRVAAAPEAFTSGALWRRKGGVTLTGLSYLPGKTPTRQRDRVIAATRSLRSPGESDNRVYFVTRSPHQPDFWPNTVSRGTGYFRRPGELINRVT
jgi:hypothetical protein